MKFVFCTLSGANISVLSYKTALISGVSRDIMMVWHLSPINED